MPTPRIRRGRLAAGVTAAVSAAAALAAALAAPAHAQTAARPAANTPAAAAGPNRALGVDTANFDRTVRPQDDFFRFVNGGWLRRTEIPADRSSWGSFLELRERSSDRAHDPRGGGARERARRLGQQKIGDMYASFVDSAAVDAKGITPLQGELRAIAAVSSPKQLPATFARMARLGVATPVGVYVSQDQRNSEQYIVGVTQSGLGLPDRDYYLKPDAKLAAARTAYAQYITASSRSPAGPTPPERPRAWWRSRRSSPASSGTARATATATPPTTG
jgi:opacity protein-like surface antigen